MVLKEKIGCRIKSLKCNQNSCNSLEAIKPQFNDVYNLIVLF